MTTPRVWLITGASSGFGRNVTEFVLGRGDIVVATLRKPEVLHELSQRYSKERLLVLKVDVTNQADIDRAFAKTEETFGRLDVVFNNAGYSIFGEAEFTPEDAARAMFDVNFWGAVNVSKAAVEFFRRVNEPGRGGVLLQNSSLVGLDSAAGLAFYSASKHAFDGFTEGLVKELLPQWNIKVCIIQPGAFYTNGPLKATIFPANPVYDGKDSALAALRNAWTTGNPEEILQGDPKKFAKAVYALVESGNMPLHLPVGQDALEGARQKVEALGKDISEASPWSADLLRDKTALVV